MADKSIEDLVISISYDVKKLVDSSKIVDKSINNTVKSAQSSFKGLFDLVNTGFTGLGIGISGLGLTGAVATITKMVTEFARAGTNSKYLSETLGLSVKNLSLMEQVAKRFGGSKEGLDSTLSSIRYRVIKNQFQQDPVLNASLQAVGAGSLYNADGSIKDPAETLIQIAQSERKSRGGINSNESLYINQALGIDQNSIRAFAQNPDVLNSTLKNVNNLGVYDDQSANAANATNNAINDLIQSFATLTRLVGLSLTPNINKMASSLQNINTFFHLSADQRANLTANSIRNLFSNIPKNAKSTLTSIPHTPQSILKGIMDFFHVGDSVNDFKKIFNGNTKKITTLSNNNQPNVFQLDANGNVINYSNASSNTRQISGRHYPSQSLRLQQILQESQGNPNAVGGYNEKELTYGLSQFRLSTARQVLKDAGLNSNIDKNYLLNPQNAIKLQQLYLNEFANKAQDLGIKDPKRIDDLALAGYNGGLVGFNNTLKNNNSFNNYINKVRAQPINAGSTNNTAMNNTNHVTNINVENVHLPNVDNSSKFIDGLKTNSMARSAYAFGTFNAS